MSQSTLSGLRETTTDVPAIRLRNLTKTFGTRNFGETKAVDGVDLDIRQGEFFSMLGPSGSGKTTVLRLIAGFELPTSGTIELEGADVSGKAPFQRDVNTVFQDYALFPHMSLVDNVAYGLRVRGMKKAERRDRAVESLERVQLGKFMHRRPSQLSGGQRQRVALARALVVEPKVLLLDEPLGALDLKLRQQMQIELKELQRSLGITFIFVTHDQEEALTMSDRIGVFNNGKLAQIGTAHEIYQRPTGAFVANFVGTSNLFGPEVATALYDRASQFVVRPERLSLHWNGTPGTLDGVSTLRGTVTSLVYVGHATQVHVALDAGPAIVVQVGNDLPAGETLVGDTVTVSWADADAVWLPEA
ncbi:spermidine/putrescine ABC transporter ATP-binding protein [Arthrobacter sp. ERGS1:01]|uniref:ABC transporter ATP-binding protein n=1 Tax=Arthrobacter sp. ERGS1:01 TaxID=1704044 RepID=UPI0006B43A01|nr:ABC transporter ATP-binding protein [Arthrobacter sp. ERGS1:01]ALE05016.1 spermidine/putrescine ABC transporter ATP-binding protein [Arthrobacter sp. ERGS1:01]